MAKSKLNSIKTFISQVLIDMNISHEKFMTILKEKDRYEMMKGNVRSENGESYEIMRFNYFFWYNNIKRKNYYAFCTIKKNFFLV